MEQNYCRRCGSLLIQINETYFKCENGHSIYSNPAPCAGVFLFDLNGKLILSVRKEHPKKGMLDTIGGFVDAKETFEDALRREIFEESGLKPTDYTTPTYVSSAFYSYDFQNESRTVLSCFYRANLIKEVNLKANDDVSGFERVNLNDFDIARIGNGDVRTAIKALIKDMA